MSRLFRGARSLLSTRVASRVPSGQEVVFHQVKVRKAKYGSRLTRLTMQLMAGYFAITVFDYVVLRPLFKGVEEAEASGVLVRVKEDEEEEEDDNIFIPFPLTTRKVIPQPYSGSDPEWREFLRISRDQELQAKMRSFLRSKVLRAANDPNFCAKFGKPTKISRSWLDLDYPLFPPPEFEQTGILINNEVIAIAVRERDPLPAQLEARVLWPKPLAMAMWATLTTTVGQSKELIYKTFGLDATKSTDQTDGKGSGSSQAIAATTGPSDVQKSIQALREQATRRPGEVPTAGTSMASTSENPALKTPTPNPAKGSTTPTAPSTGGKPEQTQTKEPSVPLKAFMEKYNQAYRPFRHYPPRGCIPVSGIIEVETPRAWVYVDVFAWYNPKTKDYDHNSLAMSVKRARLRTKKPVQ